MGRAVTLASLSAWLAALPPIQPRAPCAGCVSPISPTRAVGWAVRSRDSNSSHRFRRLNPSQIGSNPMFTNVTSRRISRLMIVAILGGFLGWWLNPGRAYSATPDASWVTVVERADRTVENRHVTYCETDGAYTYFEFSDGSALDVGRFRIRDTRPGNLLRARSTYLVESPVDTTVRHHRRVMACDVARINGKRAVIVTLRNGAEYDLRGLRIG